MALRIVSILLVTTSIVIAQSTIRRPHPDVGLTIKELVPKYGYPFEVHTVITKDGYILELHRIPYGKRNVRRGNRPAVLLVAGLLCNSDSWVNTGPKRGLAFILADSGYDVWLANHRGTTWSQKHVSLSSNRREKEFWNFSFHEMGIYDNPAIIDRILSVTKQKQICYIGHSQGTTSFFAMTSVLPEYNEKIRLMIGLAPVTYFSNVVSPIVKTVQFFKKQAMIYIKARKKYGLLQHNKFVTATIATLCKDGSSTQVFCTLFVSLFGGFNLQQWDTSLVPVIGSSVPAGASWKQFSHFLQAVESGEFKYYDYGTLKNLLQYGQSTPPHYNFKNMKAPVAVYYGNNDYLAAEKDVLRMAKELPNVIHKKLIKNFNHQDFLWATDVVPLLYDDVLRLMNSY